MTLDSRTHYNAGWIAQVFAARLERAPASGDGVGVLVMAAADIFQLDVPQRVRLSALARTSPADIAAFLVGAADNQEES